MHDGDRTGPSPEDVLGLHVDVEVRQGRSPFDSHTIPGGGGDGGNFDCVDLSMASPVQCVNVSLWMGSESCFRGVM